jgi:uncharacterized membrane protein YdbT with pleckstrin-like domain
MLGFSLKRKLNDLVFCNQNPDEKVIKILRRGFILELGWITLYLAIFAGLIVVRFFASEFAPNENLNSLLSTFLNAAFIFLGLFALNNFINWFYSVNIITNQRLIDFEFKDLGFKSIVECQVKNVQSVSIRNEGFFSFIFGLSTIHILTSGDNPNIDFEFIYNSNEIQDLISDMTRGIYPKDL